MYCIAPLKDLNWKFGLSNQRSDPFFVTKYSNYTPAMNVDYILSLVNFMDDQIMRRSYLSL